MFWCLRYSTAMSALRWRATPYTMRPSSKVTVATSKSVITRSGDPAKGPSKNHVTLTFQILPTPSGGGHGLFDFCAIAVDWNLNYFFPDVRDAFGIRGAQAWESDFRLLRMNVQGYHTFLAIWLTGRNDNNHGFRPGAPSNFSFF